MENIRKRKYDKDFTILNNSFLKDERLSWKCKGLIAYVMMLPDNWNLNMKDLKNRSADGRDSVLSGMKEMIKFGYCNREQKRSEDGTIIGCDYEVSDMCMIPETENPYMDKDKPDTGKPDTGNQPLISTKEKVSTEGSSLFPETNPNRKTLFSNSVFGDEKNGFDVFVNKLVKKDDEISKQIDYHYYYNAIKDWSDSADKKRSVRGWLATARTFMRGDKDKGRLKVKTTEKSNASAKEYLNDFS